MNELQSIRKELGYTQEEACKILKKSRRSLQFYENEKSQLSNKQEEVYEELVRGLSDILKRDCSGRIYTVKQIKKIATDVFSKHKEVQCAYLFGSYSRGEVTTESDIDILLIAPELLGFAFGGMVYELMEAFDKKIDLITLNSISDNVSFLSQILWKGEKIYDIRSSTKKRVD